MGVTAVRREAAPLRTQVVGLLRDAIVRAEFAPGERLIERTMCERFEVSRTVVREALRQLESEGLVEMVANHGPVVATLTTQDAMALYEVREVLEAMTGRAFALRATAAQKAKLKQRMKDVEAALDSGGLGEILTTKDAFYDALLDGAGNSVARGMLLGIHARSNMLRGRTLQSPGRTAHTRQELAAITKAATAGDADAAWAACAAHVQSAARIAASLLHGSDDVAVIA